MQHGGLEGEDPGVHPWKGTKRGTETMERVLSVTLEGSTFVSSSASHACRENAGHQEGPRGKERQKTRFFQQ